MRQRPARGRSSALLKRLREKSRGLVDQPLPCPAHVRAAEHRLRMMAVYRVADPDLDAAVPKGLAAAVDLADIEGGDGVVEGHSARLLPASVSLMECGSFAGEIWTQSRFTAW